MKLSLPSKWFLGLAILLGDLLLVAYFAIRLTLPPYLVRQIEADLRRDAFVVRDVFEAQLQTRHPGAPDINHLSHELAKETGLDRVVLPCAACFARFKSTAAGGVLVMNVKLRSSYTVISTGTMLPFCDSVSAL